MSLEKRQQAGMALSTARWPVPAESRCVQHWPIAASDSADLQEHTADPEAHSGSLGTAFLTLNAMLPHLANILLMFDMFRK